jgi:hypothetical protein
LIWVITLNGASLSKDLAQRVIVVKVKRPSYSPTWENKVRDYIEENRWAIIGDIVAELRAPALVDDDVRVRLRWGPWEQEVLFHVPQAVRCQSLTLERQGEIDDDAEMRNHLREAFRSLLEKNGYRPPDDYVVAFTAAEVAKIVREVTGDKKHDSDPAACKFLKQHGVPEIGTNKKTAGTLTVWRGANVSPDADPDRFRAENPETSPPWWKRKGRH